MSLTYKIKAKNLMEKAGLISKELADKAQKEADIDGIIKNIIGTKEKQVDRGIIATVKNGRYRVTDKVVNGESEIAKTVASLIYYVYIEKQIPVNVLDDTSIGTSNGNKTLTINISDAIKHDFSRINIIYVLCHVSDGNGSFVKPLYEVREDGLHELENEFMVTGNLYLYPQNYETGFYVFEFDTTQFEENEEAQYQKNKVRYKMVSKINGKFVYNPDKYKVHDIDKFGICEVITDNERYVNEIESSDKLEEPVEVFEGNKYILNGDELYGPYRFINDDSKYIHPIDNRLRKYDGAFKYIYDVNENSVPATSFIYEKTLNMLDYNEIDMTSEDVFLDKMVSIIKEKSRSLSKKELIGAFESIAKDEKFSDRYKDRIAEFRRKVETQADADGLYNYILSLIRNKTSVGNAFVERVVKDESAMESIKEYSQYKDIISAIKDETVKKQKELDGIDVEAEKVKLKDVKNEKERIEKDVQELLRAKGFVGGYEELLKQVDEKNQEKEAIQESINELTEILDKKINEIAPDSRVIKNMMEKKVEKLINEQKEREKAKERTKIKAKTTRECNKMEIVTDVKDVIVQRFKDCRNTLKYNDIMNMMICVAQGYITMFVGEPGSGKTSMCKIINNIICGDMRSNIVTVNRGWTNKGDFIGFYNSITHEVTTANKDVYKALQILDYEGADSKFPYYITLDEANLSPMEYYWCDFLGMADNINSKIVGEVDIGDTEGLKVPRTLRFLATLNTDSTTEVISPRMIDRSWVIKVNSDGETLDFRKMQSELENKSVVSQENIDTIFGVRDRTSEKTIEVMKGFKNDIKGLRDIGIVISNRNVISIENYINTALEVFEKDEMHDSIESAICDYVICEKVLPRVQVYGDNAQTVLTKFNKVCKSKYPMASAELSRIIENGVEDQDNYRYFN